MTLRKPTRSGPADQICRTLTSPSSSKSPQLSQVPTKSEAVAYVEATAVNVVAGTIRPTADKQSYRFIVADPPNVNDIARGRIRQRHVGHRIPASRWMRPASRARPDWRRPGCRGRHPYRQRGGRPGRPAFPRSRCRMAGSWRVRQEGPVRWRHTFSTCSHSSRRPESLRWSLRWAGSPRIRLTTNGDDGVDTSTT